MELEPSQQCTAKGQETITARSSKGILIRYNKQYLHQRVVKQRDGYPEKPCLWRFSKCNCRSPSATWSSLDNYSALSRELDQRHPWVLTKVHFAMTYTHISNTISHYCGYLVIRAGFNVNFHFTENVGIGITFHRSFNQTKKKSLKFLKNWFEIKES